jgi:predicted RNA-binding protein (virulence factor B family)
MAMVAIGQFNQLSVIEIGDRGVYLDDTQQGRIFLSRRPADRVLTVGDNVDVFIYTDSNHGLVATTETPLACVDEFAWLKVVDINDVGAFLDWGLPKDLLLPYSEQKYEPEIGRRVMVKVFLDKQTNRIAASTRIDNFLEEESTHYITGQEVDLLIVDKTELGYKAIVNHTHWGVLYTNELYQEISKGQRISGFIKRLRDDHKIDLTLEQPGYERIPSVADQIIEILKHHDGYLMVTDKTSPETIRSIFKVSKKVYKKAVGALYKQRRIDIEENGIRLLE